MCSYQIWLKVWIRGKFIGLPILSRGCSNTSAHYHQAFLFAAFFRCVADCIYSFDWGIDDNRCLHPYHDLFFCWYSSTDSWYCLFDGW